MQTNNKSTIVFETEYSDPVRFEPKPFPSQALSLPQTKYVGDANKFDFIIN